MSYVSERRHAEKLSQLLHQTVSSKNEYFSSNRFEHNEKHQLPELKTSSFHKANQKFSEKQEKLNDKNSIFYSQTHDSDCKSEKYKHISDKKSHKLHKNYKNPTDSKHNKHSQKLSTSTDLTTKNNDCDNNIIKTADQMWEEMLKNQLNKKSSTPSYPKNEIKTSSILPLTKSENAVLKYSNVAFVSNSSINYTCDSFAKSCSSYQPSHNTAVFSQKPLSPSLTSSASLVSSSSKNYKSLSTVSLVARKSMSNHLKSSLFPKKKCHKEKRDQYINHLKKSHFFNNDDEDEEDHKAKINRNDDDSGENFRIVSQTVSIKRTTLDASNLQNFDSLYLKKNKKNDDEDGVKNSDVACSLVTSSTSLNELEDRKNKNHIKEPNKNDHNNKNDLKISKASNIDSTAKLKMSKHDKTPSNAPMPVLTSVSNISKTFTTSSFSSQFPTFRHNTAYDKTNHDLIHNKDKNNDVNQECDSIDSNLSINVSKYKSINKENRIGNADNKEKGSKEVLGNVSSTSSLLKIKEKASRLSSSSPSSSLSSCTLKSSSKERIKNSSNPTKAKVYDKQNPDCSTKISKTPRIEPSKSSHSLTTISSSFKNAKTTVTVSTKSSSLFSSSSDINSFSSFVHDMSSSNTYKKKSKKNQLNLLKEKKKLNSSLPVITTTTTTITLASTSASITHHKNVISTFPVSKFATKSSIKNPLPVIEEALFKSKKVKKRILSSSSSSSSSSPSSRSISPKKTNSSKNIKTQKNDKNSDNVINKTTKINTNSPKLLSSTSEVSKTSTMTTSSFSSNEKSLKTLKNNKNEKANQNFQQSNVVVTKSVSKAKNTSLTNLATTTYISAPSSSIKNSCVKSSSTNQEKLSTTSSKVISHIGSIETTNKKNSARNKFASMSTKELLMNAKRAMLSKKAHNNLIKEDDTVPSAKPISTTSSSTNLLHTNTSISSSIKNNNSSSLNKDNFEKTNVKRKNFKKSYLSDSTSDDEDNETGENISINKSNKPIIQKLNSSTENLDKNCVNNSRLNNIFNNKNINTLKNKTALSNTSGSTNKAKKSKIVSCLSDSSTSSDDSSISDSEYLTMTGFKSNNNAPRKVNIYDDDDKPKDSKICNEVSQFLKKKVENTRLLEDNKSIKITTPSSPASSVSSVLSKKRQRFETNEVEDNDFGKHKSKKFKPSIPNDDKKLISNKKPSHNFLDKDKYEKKEQFDRLKTFTDINKTSHIRYNANTENFTATNAPTHNYNSKLHNYPSPSSSSEHIDQSDFIGAPKTNALNDFDEQFILNKKSKYSEEDKDYSSKLIKKQDKIENNFKTNYTNVSEHTPTRKLSKSPIKVAEDSKYKQQTPVIYNPNMHCGVSIDGSAPCLNNLSCPVSLMHL